MSRLCNHIAGSWSGLSHGQIVTEEQKQISDVHFFLNDLIKAADVTMNVVIR